MSDVEKEQSQNAEVAEQTNGTETKDQNGTETEKTNSSEPSALELDIIRQIEYYFGDINMPRDKFLQEQLKLDDGWVPFEVLTKFHRLAKLSTDIEVICAAITKSTTGLIEVSEDGKKLRRSPEMPLPELNEERRKALMERSVYVKGFPKDANVDLCLNYFQSHPVVENVVMRRYMERSTHKYHFKGSIFATFKTREQAQQFIEAGPHKYGDTELIVRWQEDYNKEKKEAYQTMKEKKIEEQNIKKEEKEKTDTINLPLGAQLHFEASGQGLTREIMKEVITENGGVVAFIDYTKGDKEGFLRLQAEGSAQAFYDKLESGKLKVGEEGELTMRVLGGEEEKAFLEKTSREMINRRRNANKNKFNRGRGRHGGGGFNRKRKQDSSTDGPAKKIQATE